MIIDEYNKDLTMTKRIYAFEDVTIITEVAEKGKRLGPVKSLKSNDGDPPIFIAFEDDFQNFSDGFAAQEDLNPAISVESADHGTYSYIAEKNPLYNVNDQSPTIMIPKKVKISKDIKSFRSENELYTFINERIVSLLIKFPKQIHREIPISSTEGVNVAHIHVCNVNKNERICYSVLFNSTIGYNKIVVLIVCYFAHNSGIKSAGGGYKKNPSHDKFIAMKNYQNIYLNELNRRLPTNYERWNIT